LFCRKYIQANLAKLFAYGHLATKLDIASHRARAKWHEPLKIMVTGGSGLIGSALAAFLTEGGRAVTKLVRSRRQAGPNALFSNPAGGEIDSSGLDMVIHQGGKSVAWSRWTNSKTKRIRASRVDSTRFPGGIFSSLDQPPRVFIRASAAGFCGDRGEELLDENSKPGRGFLSGVCREWEQAAHFRGQPN